MAMVDKPPTSVVVQGTTSGGEKQLVRVLLYPRPADTDKNNEDSMTDKKQALQEARGAAMTANAAWREACRATNIAAGVVVRAIGSDAKKPREKILSKALSAEERAREALHAAMCIENKALREAEDAGVET